MVGPVVRVGVLPGEVAPMKASAVAKCHPVVADIPAAAAVTIPAAGTEADTEGAEVSVAAAA